MSAVSEFHGIAFAKMSRVLGAERAQRLLSEILGALDLRLETADDLLSFANELSKRGGFEGAVGAMLSVRALMRGAGPKLTDSRSPARTEET